ncbi:MAG: CPXCG motif-containing cysteine-rich protein [Candidatus Hydrogenedentota bacterium]|nr:MAG: CPXCG motif-containing cysteine-rich protein [Candidatus Hydrogenedentota bacterium]
MLDTGATVTCPHCWEQFVMQVDLGALHQTLIYDCLVCCNPLEIEYRITVSGVDVVEVTAVQ